MKLTRKILIEIVRNKCCNRRMTLKEYSKTTSKRKGCDNIVTQMDGCNFLKDVDNEYDLPIEEQTLCNCCAECRHQCTMDI